MTVVRLVERSNADTVELLECMLALARVGELGDMETTFTRQGVEQMAFTGRYRAHPSVALHAAFRMVMELALDARNKRSD